MDFVLPLIWLLLVVGGWLFLVRCAVQAAADRQAQRKADPAWVLRRQKRGETFDTFREGIRGVQVPDRILHAVYDRLSNGTFWLSGFPVRATDSLHDVYGIGDPGNPDVDLLIREVAARCGLEVVPSQCHWALPLTAGALAVYLAAIQAESAAKHASEVLLRPADGSGGDMESLLRPVAASHAPTDSELLRLSGER